MQLKLNHSVDEQLKLQNDYERLNDNLKQSKLKIEELNVLVDIK